MLAELQNKCIKKLTSKIFNTDLETPDPDAKTEIDNMQLNMVELYRKYNNPGKVDSLFTIKNDVEDIKSSVKNTMKTMLNNITELTVINNIINFIIV